jgi:hypothetical protein
MEKAESTPGHPENPRQERVGMRIGCVVPVLSGEFCDFCTADKVFKLYRCKNFFDAPHYCTKPT